MDIMIFDKRNRRFGMMFIFALLLSSIEYTHGEVSLLGCANPVVYSSCDLTCQTPHQNVDAVTFFQPPDLSSVIAQCSSTGTCGALPGYSIHRSSATTTVFTILNYTCTDSVKWRCDYNSDSATHDLSCVDFPQTATTTDMSDNSVVNSSVVITVNLGCLVSEGTVQMKFDFKNSGGTIVDSSALSTCSNVSTCTDPLYSTYECQVNLQKESNVLCETKYSIEANVKLSDADRTESIHLLNDVEFTCQSTDSCEFDYWICIWYILATDYISSGICTLVVVVWWKTKRKEIKAKSITCWLGQHIFCCCSEKIKRFCEKYKITRIWGARVLLLADVFVIGMLVSIVVWLFAVIVVILTCSSCIEGLDKLAVAGISLVLSLLASAIWTAIVLLVYLIASCCKNNGCVCKPGNRITKEAGDDINFLEQRPHEFKRIKSIDLTKDGTPVSPEEYEVKMTAVPSLILKMVSLEQSGKYECTISYDLTKKEVHQLNLLVTPKQYEVKMGDRKTLLKCLRNLNGIEDVKWTLNNIAIPADSLFYKGGTKSNPSLTVKYCSTSDSGLYICNIRTTKSSKRFSAQLKTREKYTVGTGKSIEFLKDLSSCRDISEISWELNGNPLELVDNQSYNGGTIESPVFTVNCATKEESGKYKCTLMLESLPTKELKFTLDLNEQLQVDSGESIVLLDKVENSNNVSSVEWTRKKRPLTCFHKGGTIECPALTIPVVSHEDSGEYNCKITLKQGNKRFYRFVVKVNVQKIKKKVGDRVVLLQNLKSAGTIQEVDWYKNGQKVQAGKDEKYQGGINQSPSLLVGSLQEHDSGLYKCDLIVKESQIKLHILVDLTVEQKENSTRLGPVIGHNRVHNHENAANNQSWTEEEQ